MGITGQSLKAAAMAKTNLENFGESFSPAALEAWVEDLNHPRLNDFGRLAFSSMMVADLARRLEVVDCLAKNPEIDAVEIPPILYISGLERTGTTFLHNLLSQHPQSRAVLRWELMRPTPPPEAGNYRDDPRIARTQASIDKHRGTLLEQMHWVDADDPEECQWGMLDGSSLLGAAAFSIMPTWGKWLAQRNPEAGFAEYRRLLKLLLWTNPVQPGGHLVLKCPQFCGTLASFAKVFPEARYIITHRDPYRAIVSVCTLIDGILGPYMAEDAVPARGGLFADSAIARAEARLPVLAAFCDRDHPVAHVAYPDLVRDPVGTIAAIYTFLAVDAPANMADRIDTFVGAQKTGKRAKPPPSLPDFGLRHEAFLVRPPIADYCRRFGIVAERQRVTGA